MERRASCTRASLRACTHPGGAKAEAIIKYNGTPRRVRPLKESIISDPANISMSPSPAPLFKKDGVVSSKKRVYILLRPSSFDQKRLEHVSRMRGTIVHAKAVIPCEPRSQRAQRHLGSNSFGVSRLPLAQQPGHEPSRPTNCCTSRAAWSAQM